MKLLFFRFQLSDYNLSNLSLSQVEKLEREWEESNLDVKYYQLIEKHFFDANAINQYYANEFDENTYEIDSYFYNDDETVWAGKQAEKNVENDLYSCNQNYKLYRRVNDTNKNIEELSISNKIPEETSNFKISSHFSDLKIHSEIRLYL